MPRKQGITIGKTRSALYTTARVLGDINAVRQGRIGQRLVNRGLGSLFWRLIRALFGRR